MGNTDYSLPHYNVPVYRVTALENKETLHVVWLLTPSSLYTVNGDVITEVDCINHHHTVEDYSTYACVCMSVCLSVCLKSNKLSAIKARVRFMYSIMYTIIFKVV